MFLFGRLKWATTIAVAAISLAACGSGTGAAGTQTSTTTSSSSQLSGSVYFLVSSATTTRWLSQDGPFFTQYMHKLAPNIHVVIENANHSVSLQQSQVEDAITKGAKAIDLERLEDGSGLIALCDVLNRLQVCILASEDRDLSSKMLRYKCSDNTSTRTIIHV